MARALKGLAILAAAALVSMPSTSAAQAVPAAATHYSGTLPDGATWIGDVPAGWSPGKSVLILYSHGYTPSIVPTNPAVDAPGAAAQQALLARGYALVGSSYASTGWAMASAVGDQFAALAALEAQIGSPGRTLALGTSMGGLVSALEDESAAGRLNGVLTTCGLVAGAIDLNNYQLDAEYTLRQLLLGNQDLPLVHFTTLAEESATTQELVAAAQTAQQTPSGRARLALAMLFLHTPTWFSGQPLPGPRDYQAQEQQQFQWVTGQLPFIELGRYDIEHAAGGNGGWNIGVDYRRVFEQLANNDEGVVGSRREVETLYGQAGLSLQRDLDELTRHANIPPDPNALAALRQTSQPTGRLTVPELDIHTIADQLVPVEQERDYATSVWLQGRASLLRQAFVQRQSHCNFTTAELVASVEALLRRVDTGRWDALAEPESLNSVANSLNLGGSAFVPFEPPPLQRT